MTPYIFIFIHRHAYIYRSCKQTNNSSIYKLISPMTPSDYSLFPSTTFTITKDHFNAFHLIDRALYSRLVLVIGLDQVESMQLMALWLWLERHSGHGRNFVQKLLTFPVAFVKMLAHESVTCLKCLENDFIMMNESSRDENNVPMLHSVLGGKINLYYFMENRVLIRVGVEKIMMETCVRAFDDILLMKGGFGGRGVQSGVEVSLYDQTRGGNMAVGEGSMYVYGGDETGEMLGNVILHEGVALGDEDQQEIIVGEVEADQRTIFLTFSKGYPTSEFEVRDFFTRRYGDIVEAIHMQEVSPEEQVLYARLVVRIAGVINVVLQGESRAKFTINGKHVWARKYVRRSTTK